MPCRKELKDPDQLYNTLKNLLAQIKVWAGGELVLWGARLPDCPRSCSPWGRGQGCDSGALRAGPPCAGGRQELPVL